TNVEIKIEPMRSRFDPDSCAHVTRLAKVSRLATRGKLAGPSAAYSARPQQTPPGTLGFGWSSADTESARRAAPPTSTPLSGLPSLPSFGFVDRFCVCLVTGGD